MKSVDHTTTIASNHQLIQVVQTTSIFSAFDEIDEAFMTPEALGPSEVLHYLSPHELRVPHHEVKH